MSILLLQSKGDGLPARERGRSGNHGAADDLLECDVVNEHAVVGRGKRKSAGEFRGDADFVKTRVHWRGGDEQDGGTRVAVPTCHRNVGLVAGVPRSRKSRCVLRRIGVSSTYKPAD